MPQLCRRSVAAGAAAAAWLAAADPAFAAGQRSFVSTSGADNPTCSIALPCRSFGAAVTATNANGAGKETATVQNCNVTNNRSGGITAAAGATVRVAYSTVTLNPVGLAPSGGGQIISMGNNWVQGNTTNGAPDVYPGGDLIGRK